MLAELSEGLSGARQGMRDAPNPKWEELTR